MSVNTPTTAATTTGTTPTTTTRGGHRSTAVLIGATAVCAVAVAGIVTSVVIAFSGHAAAHAAAPSHTVAPHPAAGTATAGTSGTHGVPANTPTPSAAVATLQRELGQLNYYEGPVTGYLNTATQQAIDYLQRDAHLPQTGTMNAATERALVAFLAHGNNAMGA